jgi:two-component system chemotaxis response regulator CheY
VIAGGRGTEKTTIVSFDVSKVLVIDDNKMMRVYLRRCLVKAGFDVEDWMPESAMEVLDHIKASAPDLILSDFQMPGCNGATVARMAQKARPGAPLLILTAFRDEEVENSLLRLGVKKVLTKPIDGEALVREVHDALGVGGHS